jgi:transcriptional regulator with XRE-family HTH domain
VKFEPPKLLGNSIRLLRKSLKLNQTEFSDLIGFSQVAVSNWEKNIRRIDYRTAERICSKLRISLGEFWGGKIDIKTTSFLLPPEDIESLKPLIESIRRIRNQWGKRGEQQTVKDLIIKLMKEGKASEEEIHKFINYIEKKS